MPTEPHGQPASDRVRLRRLAERGRYAADEVRAVLDAGTIAHLGVATPDGPIVIPMAFGHEGDTLYLHGSVANAAMRGAAGQEVCVTVTVLDALVVGRTPFHSSMNYRSVVVRGRARKVEDPDERWRALSVVSDHIVATWDTGRPPSDKELRQTLVLAVPLTEASAKVRTGDPKDDPEDLEGPHWAGVVPITTVWEAPQDSGDLRPGVHVPPAIAALTGTRVHGDPA